MKKAIIATFLILSLSVPVWAGSPFDEFVIDKYIKQIERNRQLEEQNNFTREQTRILREMVDLLKQRR